MELEEEASAELIPQDIVSNPASHTLYVSTKYANNVFVIGPNAISTTIPVIAKDTPAATAIGVITAHGQDVQVSESLADIKTKAITMKVELTRWRRTCIKDSKSYARCKG